MVHTTLVCLHYIRFYFIYFFIRLMYSSNNKESRILFVVMLQMTLNGEIDVWIRNYVIYSTVHSLCPCYENNKRWNLLCCENLVHNPGTSSVCVCVYLYIFCRNGLSVTKNKLLPWIPRKYNGWEPVYYRTPCTHRNAGQYKCIQSAYASLYWIITFFNFFSCFNLVGFSKIDFSLLQFRLVMFMSSKEVKKTMLWTSMHSNLEYYKTWHDL